MAIKTSTFSGWRLSGKDADAFLEQINNAKENLLAQNSLDRGRKLMAEYDRRPSARESHLKCVNSIANF